jgi:hypothetical protein
MATNPLSTLLQRFACARTLPQAKRSKASWMLGAAWECHRAAVAKPKRIGKDCWKCRNSTYVVAEPSTGELFQHVYEAVLTEETKAQEANRGNRLSDEALRSRSAEITQHLMAMLRDAGGEVLAAQNANSVDFDRDVMPYTNPLDSRTYLEIAQDDRAKLVAALMKVARDIASQNDSGTRPDKYSAYADFLNKHAREITRDNTTRDPFRAAQIRREEARQRAGKRLIEAACTLMSRPSNLSTSAPNTLIEGIRAKSGSRRDSTQNEIDAINEYNKRTRK